MNLIITDSCNRACPYCFARLRTQGEVLAPGQRPAFMSTADFDYCLAFLQRSQAHELKLLGGEPTLHPEFIRFVETGLSAGFSVSVFTNGLWPEGMGDACARFCTAHGEKISFIFNINEARFTPPEQRERAESNMRRVGSRGICSFNIFQPGFDLTFLADVMDRTGLGRRIRVGIAHPIVTKDNIFYPLHDLPVLGQRLVEQVSRLEPRDVLVSPDCGFHLCAFTPEQLGRLFLGASDLHSVCSFPIDVGTDLTAWPCFPLSAVLNVNLRDFENRDALLAFYDGKLAPFRTFGTLPECADCRFLRRGQCCGGCVAHTLNQWRSQGDPGLLERLARTGAPVPVNEPG